MLRKELRISIVVGLLVVGGACGSEQPPGSGGGSGGDLGGAGGSAADGGGAGSIAPECDEGEEESCYDADPSTLGVGECRAGVKTCLGGRWSNCSGSVMPREEDPCNRRDDDCDGETLTDPALCWSSFITMQGLEHLHNDGKVVFGLENGNVGKLILGTVSSDGGWSRSGGPMPTFVMVDEYVNKGVDGNWVAQAQDGVSTVNATVPDRPGFAVLDGTVDGMTTDPFRFGWISTDEPALYRVVNGYPTQSRVLVPLEGEEGPGLSLPRPTQGLTTDHLGYVWTGSAPSLRIEPHSITWEEVPHTKAGRPFAYGRSIWFAADPVHVISAEPPFDERVIEGFAAESIQATLGHILALSGGAVVEIDPGTLERTPRPFPDGVGPARSLASDGAGRFLATFGSSQIAIYDVTSERWTLSTLGYSLLPDLDLIDGTRDLGTHGAVWGDFAPDRDVHVIDWFGDTPGKSRVIMHLLVADSAEGLKSSRTWCSFTKAPADVSACAAGKRYMRVEFLLVPDGDDRPSVNEAYWFGPP